MGDSVNLCYRGACVNATGKYAAPVSKVLTVLIVALAIYLIAQAAQTFSKL